MGEEYGEEIFRRPKPPKGGRLHKGVVLQHARTPSAIPSKNEIEGAPVSHSRTVENNRSTREGFAARTKREDPFATTREKLQTPGPGTYTRGCDVKVETDDASTSKKGLGGFASQTKRFPSVAPATTNAPGPGQYYDPKKDSSIQLDQPKVIPNYSQFLPDHDPSPGPSDYTPHEIRYSSPQKGRSAFLDTGQRVDVLPKTAHESRKMGPGKYDPKPASDYKKESVASPFKSDVERRLELGESDTPGPGTYESVSSYDRKLAKTAKVKPTPQGKIQNPTRPQTPDSDDDLREQKEQQKKQRSKKPSPGPGQYLPLFPNPQASHPSPSAPPHIRRRSVPSTPGSSFVSSTHRTELIALSSAPSTLGPGGMLI